MNIGRFVLLLVTTTFLLCGADPWLEQMNSGNRLRLSGDLPGAETHYLAALELARSLEEDHSRYGQTLNNLAGVYQDRQDYAKAEPLLLRSLAIQERILGPAHHQVAVCLTNLGVLYGQIGRFSDAEAAYQRAIRITEQLGRAGEGQLAVASGELGGLYLEAGRLEAAERSLRRALPLADRVLGPNHRKTIRITLYIGNIEYAKGRYSQAESSWLRALSAVESAPLKDRLTTATLRMNLGELKRFERRYAESESLLRSAIAGFERIGNGSHPLLPAALNHLALTCAEQGETGKAERAYVRTLAILENSPDMPLPARRQHAVTLNNFARLREQQSAPAEAALLFRRALESAEIGFGPGHRSLKVFLHDYSRILRSLRRSREARVFEQRARSISSQEPPRRTVDLRDLRRLETDSGQR